MLNISRNKIYFLGLICALVMCISGIYAFTNMSIVTVENELNSGAINIELKEYTINEKGEEVIYNDSNQEFFPGKVVSFIPRISNLGEDCFIRAKFTYIDINEQIISADENIEKTTEDWVKIGDYWYYKLVVNSGEKVDLFKSLKLPTDMSNEYQGKTIFLNTVVEAVQARNFEPNFNSDDPWHNITAKKATNESYQTDKIQLNSNVKIEYENNAELYINVPDTFFGKLNNILPGDVIIQEATINNRSSKEIEYFVSTDELLDMSDKQLQFLEKLNLTISVEDKILYEGKINKINKLSLGKYKPNASSKVEFIITVPKDLENEYSELNATVKWVFSITGEDKVEPPEEEPKDEVVEGPQTGDFKTIIVFTIFFVSAIGLIISLILEKRIKKNYRKN